MVHLGHVRNKLDDTTRVTPLVVVPRDELDKVGVEGDASSGVKDGRVGVSYKVSRDNGVVSVAEDALCNSKDLEYARIRNTE